MKKSIATKWAKALRSGEYPQGKDALAKKDENGMMKYCCLGVLCEIAHIGGVCNITLEGAYKVYNSNTGVLPSVVADFAEMKTECGDIPSLSATLVGLNDQGRSFSEIADIIEKHYEEL